MTEADRIYKKLSLIRQAEQAIIREYPSNDIKTPCHLAIGAEGIAVAVTERFPKAKIFASYRNHHWYLACGGNLDDFFLELYGKQNKIADGKAGSMHLSAIDKGLMLTSAVVASQIGPAVGHAFAMKYKNEPTLTICVLGDGATEEGVFYENLNIAKLFKLKILFVLEDNNLAIHQPKDVRQAFKIRAICDSYDIPYFQGMFEHGNVTRVLDKISSFPTLCHFKYHRFLEHVGPNEDYSAGYRPKPQKPNSLDPVYLFGKSILPAKKCEIEIKVHEQIEAAIEKAKAAPVAPLNSLLEHVFAD